MHPLDQQHALLKGRQLHTELQCFHKGIVHVSQDFERKPPLHAAIQASEISGQMNTPGAD